MSPTILVQTSVPSEELAHSLAHTLVQRRLAAGCWISGPIKSIYWWKGQQEQAHEWVCQFKTRTDLFPVLETTIRTLHPYEVPEIVATSITFGSASFLAWIQSETQQSSAYNLNEDEIQM